MSSSLNSDDECIIFVLMQLRQVTPSSASLFIIIYDFQEILYAASYMK
jgi:hypothetical protein